MTSKLPTDPLGDASTGVVRRSRGAFLKTVPERKRDRRDPRRQAEYAGPERRKNPQEPLEAESEKATRRLFGQPRWLVIAAGVYLAALALALVWAFTY
jgi:hypothetical protein